MADRWPTHTSPDYNCEVAIPACRKKTTLGYPPVAVALLVVGLPVTKDWFEMGCYFSPSLISISLMACCTSIPRKRRGNHKQTTTLFLHEKLMAKTAFFKAIHFVSTISFDYVQSLLPHKY